MYEFKFPFEPPWEDLKMELTSSTGAKVYIFDTFSKHMTKEDKERADRAISDIYLRHAEREFLQNRKAEEAGEA